MIMQEFTRYKLNDLQDTDSQITLSESKQSDNKNFFTTSDTLSNLIKSMLKTFYFYIWRKLEISL